MTDPAPIDAKYLGFVREVRTTQEAAVVNALLATGWKLIGLSTTEYPTFVLGRFVDLDAEVAVEA